MQIIVNCLVPFKGGIVMLQKPRRGWWVLPGGKIEPSELWPDAAKREVLEETGLHAHGVKLQGIHQLDIAGSDNEPSKQRLIAQFVASHAEGVMLDVSKEGPVAINQISDLDGLPMDAGDKIMLQHTLWARQNAHNEIFFGKFTYTSDLELKSWFISPTITTHSRAER